MRIVTEPGELTDEWVRDALGADVTVDGEPERIGTGQMSRNYRVRLRGDGPPSIVVKVPAADVGMREIAASTYRREVEFYATVAPRVGGRRPQCLAHAIDATGAAFTLVLEDLSPARQGDQIAGCTLADARLALGNLAELHATTWDDGSLREVDALAPSDPTMLGPLYRFAHDQFVANYDDRLAPGTRAVLDALPDRLVAWLEHQPGPCALVHGDYRLDNLLFTDDSVAAVDWQTVAVAPPARDVAYFLGNSLRTDDRRAHEGDLLDGYLASLVAHGVRYERGDLLVDYARGTWLGPFIAVLGAFAATRTERGDDMFVAMVDRAAAQIVDHGALVHLPE